MITHRAQNMADDSTLNVLAPISKSKHDFGQMYA